MGVLKVPDHVPFCEETSARILLVFLFTPAMAKEMRYQRLIRGRNGGVFSFFWVSLPRRRPHAGLHAAMWSEFSLGGAGVHSYARARVCESVLLRGEVWQAQLVVILTPHSPVSFNVTVLPLIALFLSLFECVHICVCTCMHVCI